MGMKNFNNGVTDGPQRRYKLSTTLTGILIVPILESEGFKMQMLYEELNERLVTNEEKVAEEVNRFILEKSGEITQNLLIWNFEEDLAYKELRRNLFENTQLERKFDGR